MPAEAWDMTTYLLERIREKGGFANCHAHLDKALFATTDRLENAMVDMEKKWRMSDDIKRRSTQNDIEIRMTTATDMLQLHGATQTISFVDAYDVVDHRAINAANTVKKSYGDRFPIKIATQPLGGLIDRTARELYEAITAKADIAGGLPSYDRPHDDAHFDALFGIAKNLNKPIHCHIDQENNPHERDTEKLIFYTKKYGYEGRVAAIHAISVSAQEKPYRERIYHELADAGIAVVVCPSAALSMRQRDADMVPTHNSIANVPEMLAAGITVGIGVDNIHDWYQPFVDGDMWIELRMLAEACRFYDSEALVDISTTNGKKIFDIT